METKYEKRLAERFRFSPQAAMTYFGILVSSCKVMIEVPDCRLLVVEDRQLGTNDCRGWISESMFKRLQAKHRDESQTRETPHRNDVSNGDLKVARPAFVTGP